MPWTGCKGLGVGMLGVRDQGVVVSRVFTKPHVQARRQGVMWKAASGCRVLNKVATEASLRSKVMAASLAHKGERVPLRGGGAGRGACFCWFSATVEGRLPANKGVQQGHGSQPHIQGAAGRVSTAVGGHRVVCQVAVFSSCFGAWVPFRVSSQPRDQAQHGN